MPNSHLSLTEVPGDKFPAAPSPWPLPRPAAVTIACYDMTDCFLASVICLCSHSRSVLRSRWPCNLDRAEQFLGGFALYSPSWICFCMASLWFRLETVALLAVWINLANYNLNWVRLSFLGGLKLVNTLFTLLFESGSLTGPWLVDLFGQAGWPEPQGSFPLGSPRAGITSSFC